MLIQSKNAKERPEAYYPIRNPDSDVWYLGEPDSVWRFSSTSRPLNKKKLQADPIETIVEEKRILWPANEEAIVYNNRDELWSAIKAGTAPKELRIYLQLDELKKLAEQDVKVARLLTYIEPLENWVGKKLGYGRPRYKRFRESLKRETNPLSSWISFASEPDEDDEDFDDVVTLVAGGTSEGTSLVRKVLENKDFAYPKPISLIKGLLAQATQPNDIVLDFFAGSGTTGQAVLELNAEDDGSRRFILCSSTEANKKEPDKNLCRDVCAERMRRVIQGYGGKSGYTPEQGGEFAYLQLDKVEAADAHFEVDAAHAFQLLALKRLGVVCAVSEGAVQRLGRVEDCELLVCNEVNADTIETLAAWPQQHGVARLAIYSTRPQTLSEQLSARGVEANCYSLMDALMSGQMGGRQGSAA